MAERFGLDHVDLKLYRVDPDAAKLVAPNAVRRYQAVPVSFVGDRTLLVAMVDPANVLAIDDIAVMTGYEVRPAVSSLQDVEWLLERLEDPDFGHGAVAPEEQEALDAAEAGQQPPRPRRRCTTCARTRRSTSAPAARTRRSSSSCTG